MDVFKKLFVYLCTFYLFTAATAQTHGKVIEQNDIQSTILHKNVAYSVYLPPDYFTSERSYPVVYLLHG